MLGGWWLQSGLGLVWVGTGQVGQSPVPYGLCHQKSDAMWGLAGCAWALLRVTGKGEQVGGK